MWKGKGTQRAARLEARPEVAGEDPKPPRRSPWQRIVVGLNLEAIGADPERPTPVLEYWSAAASTVDRMERFRRMCAYLDARGRALVEGKERVSG